MDLERFLYSIERLRQASITSKRSWYQIDEPKTIIDEEISFEIQKMSRVVFSGYIRRFLYKQLLSVIPHFLTQDDTDTCPMAMNNL